MMRRGRATTPDGPVPLVGNPAAGGGRGALRMKEAQALLAVKGFDVQVVPTKAPGHAATLVHELADDGAGTIFVCGGDGTISEACEGALAARQTPVLGLLPAGTGNDFLRDFGIHDRPHAADRIALGHRRQVDAAHLRHPGGERTFVNVFGTGFMAVAGATANAHLKWMGRRAYTAAVLIELLRLSRSLTRIVLDGVEQETEATMVAVCNSAHTGGAMKIAPQARPDDGELDVVIVDACSRRELLNVFPRIFDGSHVRHDRVRMERARRIEIEVERPSPLLVDGEVLSETPVAIEVLPGALSILA